MTSGELQFARIRDTRLDLQGQEGQAEPVRLDRRYTELTASTHRGARVFLLPPPKVAIGNPHESVLLPCTVAELMALRLKSAEVAVYQGFTRRATTAAMEPGGSTVFIAASRSNGGSRRTRKRLAAYRVASPTSRPCLSLAREPVLP